MQSAPASVPASNPSPDDSFPASRFRMIFFCLVALAAGIGVTLWIEEIRYERFPGFLQAKLRTITSGRDAKISRILVAPGSVVLAGQPLVELEDESFSQRYHAKKHEVDSLEIELARDEARLDVELAWRRKEILDRIFEARLKSAESLRRQLGAPVDTPAWNRIVQQTSGELPPVVPAPDSSSIIFSDPPKEVAAAGDRPARTGLLSPQVIAITEMELCNEHIRELEKLNRELPDKISRSMGVNLARAKLDHARLELAALEAQKKELILVAEAPGMVGVFQREVGDHVTPYEPIVQLLDEDQPYLMMQFPSSRIAKFTPGTIVDLRFPGGLKGKGKILEIPPQATSLPNETGTHPETVITAHIDPVGALWPNLPFGSTVEVRRRR